MFGNLTNSHNEVNFRTTHSHSAIWRNRCQCLLPLYKWIWMNASSQQPTNLQTCNCNNDILSRILPSKWWLKKMCMQLFAASRPENMIEIQNRPFRIARDRRSSLVPQLNSTQLNSTDTYRAQITQFRIFFAATLTWVRAAPSAYTRKNFYFTRLMNWTRKRRRRKQRTHICLNSLFEWLCCVSCETMNTVQWMNSSPVDRKGLSSNLLYFLVANEKRSDINAEPVAISKERSRKNSNKKKSISFWPKKKEKRIDC